MPTVKNLASVAIALVKKDGSAESVRAGEEATIAFDSDNEHNKQMIAMGAIEVGSESSARPAKKAAAKKASRSRKG